jgi:hypothetical protein
MKKFVRSFLAAAVVLVALQCQDRESPVAVDQSSSLITAAATPEQLAEAREIEQMIRDLFRADEEQTVVNKFCAAANLYISGKTAKAHAQLFQLINLTLNRYRAGRLECGQTAECREQVVELLNALFDFFGIEGDSVPPEALEHDGAFKVCGPSGCLVKTGTEWAGVRIPAGALDRQVAIFIYRLPDNSEPLNTRLPQYPLFYFFGSDPAVEFDGLVDVALCTLDSPPHDIGAPEGANLRLAHNEGDGIEVLDLGPSDFIDCSDAVPSDTALHTPAWNHYAGLLFRPLSPGLLYAMPGPLGGQASNFSPFGGVDIGDSDSTTTTILDADPNEVQCVEGSCPSVTLTANVSPDPPTVEEGEVEFYEVFENGERNFLGNDFTNSDGVATLEVFTGNCETQNCIGFGGHTLIAEFTGTASHAPSTSNEEEVFVSD